MQVPPVPNWRLPSALAGRRGGGREAARTLRLRYLVSELPIIALTAAALVSERQQALQAGMTDFVSKPFDPEQRLRALDAAL